jgi:c-di-GMP-binding flagellar brake protein YcgR
MNVNEMIPGAKLDITIMSHSGVEQKPVYVSQLEEVLKDGSIVIDAPIHEGKLIPISTGSMIKVCFLHPKGFFSFKGEIALRAKRDNILVLKVKIIGNIHKIQRREYFRFECLMSVRFRVVKSEGKDNSDDSWNEALIRDISGGGMGLLTNKPYHINDFIEIEFNLDGISMKSKSKIVRCLLYDQDSSKYDVGISFQGMNTKDRDNIIKFIFERQRKLRQKGLV